MPESYADLLTRQRADVATGLFSAMRRMRWSADRLAAERERRLREILAWSIERCPWHAGRLAGIDVGRFTEADLPSLPTMDKSEMMANYNGAVSDPRLTVDVVNAHVDTLDEDAYLFDEFRAVTSSGSTGARAQFVYGWDDWVDLVLIATRWRGREGDGLPLDASVGTTLAYNSRHLSGVLHAFFRNSDDDGPAVTHLPATLPIPEIVAGLNAARPQILQGYPSVVHLLALESLAGRLDIRPKRVQTGGESCTAEVRAAVAEAWGIKVYDCYACTEGIYAFPCEAGDAMHLPDDLVIVEPVDLDGNAVAPGEPAAKILLTNLYNRAQPLIRYEITDSMTMLPGVCDCGCAHRRITDLAGRTDAFFVYEGGAAVHHSGMAAVLLKNNVIEVQVKQTVRGVAVSLATKGPCDLDEMRRGLVELMTHSGVVDAQAEIEVVDAMDRMWNGKVRQFQPLEP